MTTNQYPEYAMSKL